MLSATETKRGPSRRDFLKITAAAGTSAVIGLLLGNQTPASADAKLAEAPLAPPKKNHELSFDPASLLDKSRKLEAEPNPEIIGPRPTDSEVVFLHYAWNDEPPPSELEGKVGREIVYPWTDLHTGPNQYNWELLYRHVRYVVDNNIKIRVKDPDGTEREIFQPLIFSPAIYLSATPGNPTQFDVQIPQFVRDHSDSGVYSFQATQTGCPVQQAPKYDNAELQRNYDDFIRAFFTEFGNQNFPGTNQPVFAGVKGIPWGIDTENGSETKDIYVNGVRCRYVDALKNLLDYWTYLGTSDSVLDRVVTAARETNSKIPVISLYTSDGKRSAYDRIVDHPTVIYGQATGAWDTSNAYQIGGDGINIGVEAIFQRAYERGVDAFIETANRLSPQETYATLYAMIATAHPRVFSLLSGVLNDIKSTPELAQTMLLLMQCTGRTESTAPIVLYKSHSTAFPAPHKIGSVNYGGHNGPYERGLHQVPVPNMAPTIQYGDRQMAGAWTAPNPPLPYPEAKDSIFGLRAEGVAPGSPFVGFEVNKQWAVNHRQNPNWGSFDLSVRIINNFENGPQPMTVMFVNGTTGQVETRTINTGPNLGSNNSFVEVKIPMWNARFRSEFQGGADFMIHSGGEGNLIFESLHLNPSRTYRVNLPSIT